MAVRPFRRWIDVARTGALRLARAAGGLLAAFTLVVSTPEHVLEPLESAPEAHAVLVSAHPAPAASLNHHAAGHVCAEHCASHVLAAWPPSIEAALPAYPGRTAWVPRPPAIAPDRAGDGLERPPRA